MRRTLLRCNSTCEFTFGIQAGKARQEAGIDDALSTKAVTKFRHLAKARIIVGPSATKLQDRGRGSAQSAAR